MGGKGGWVGGGIVMQDEFRILCRRQYEREKGAMDPMLVVSHCIPKSKPKP